MVHRLYSARGSAFLYVRPTFQQDTEPAVTPLNSSPLNLSLVTRASDPMPRTQVIDSINDTFVDRFYYTGTRDYIPFATINNALEFRNEVLGGDDQVIAYNQNLASEGAATLTAMWNSSVLAPPSMMEMSITTVALPIVDNVTGPTECSACGTALKAENIWVLTV